MACECKSDHAHLVAPRHFRRQPTGRDGRWDLGPTALRPYCPPFWT